MFHVPLRKKEATLAGGLSFFHLGPAAASSKHVPCSATGKVIFLAFIEFQQFQRPIWYHVGLRQHRHTGIR
jgi:hypothetical protein